MVVAVVAVLAVLAVFSGLVGVACFSQMQSTRAAGLMPVGSSNQMHRGMLRGLAH